MCALTIRNADIAASGISSQAFGAPTKDNLMPPQRAQPMASWIKEVNKDSIIESLQSDVKDLKLMLLSKSNTGGGQ